MLNRHIQHQNNKKQQLNSLILKESAVIYFFKTDKVGIIPYEADVKT